MLNKEAKESRGGKSQQRLGVFAVKLRLWKHSFSDGYAECRGADLEAV